MRGLRLLAPLNACMHVGPCAHAVQARKKAYLQVARRGLRRCALRAAAPPTCQAGDVFRQAAACLVRGGNYSGAAAVMMRFGQACDKVRRRPPLWADAAGRLRRVGSRSLSRQAGVPGAPVPCALALGSVSPGSCLAPAHFRTHARSTRAAASARRTWALSWRCCTPATRRRRGGCGPLLRTPGRPPKDIACRGNAGACYAAPALLHPPHRWQPAFPVDLLPPPSHPQLYQDAMAVDAFSGCDEAFAADALFCAYAEGSADKVKSAVQVRRLLAPLRPRPRDTPHACTHAAVSALVLAWRPQQLSTLSLC